MGGDRSASAAGEMPVGAGQLLSSRAATYLSFINPRALRPRQQVGMPAGAPDLAP